MLLGIGSLTAILLTALIDHLSSQPEGPPGAGGLAWAQPVRPGTPPGPDNFRPQRVVPPFPPITEFGLRPVQQVAEQINPTELVLGVTVNGQSRAYPINMLTGPRREIINDQLGGHAIAATW